MHKQNISRKAIRSNGGSHTTDCRYDATNFVGCPGSDFAASSGRGPESPINLELALDKPRPIPSPRQIHPLYGEKAGLLGYYDAVGNTENFPPAPNIVVEGGRIEFVRPSHDGTTTRRNTISRASQTFVEQQEKSDPIKTRQAPKNADDLRRVVFEASYASTKTKTLVPMKRAPIARQHSKIFCSVTKFLCDVT
ncbi:hypothetical protein PV326_007437 [Microctonus aethiopoides]|nr:hypothetical protein PV326_007437 [Microctonus aethiopoides]